MNVCSRCLEDASKTTALPAAESWPRVDDPVLGVACDRCGSRRNFAYVVEPAVFQ